MKTYFRGFIGGIHRDIFRFHGYGAHRNGYALARSVADRIHLFARRYAVFRKRRSLRRAALQIIVAAHF